MAARAPLLALALSLAAGSPAGCGFGECSADPDCPLDRVCEAGTCQLSCAYPEAACPSTAVCVSGRCRARCTGPDSCRSDMRCDPSGVCVLDSSDAGTD